MTVQDDASSLLKRSVIWRINGSYALSAKARQG